MLCRRCMRRLRDALNQSAELCAHLRAMIVPLRAQAYDDREIGSPGAASFAPAPLDLDLVDAGDAIIDVLRWWSQYFGDRTTYGTSEGFAAGSSVASVYVSAKWAADYLLFNFERIVNDSWIVMFSRKVLDWPADRGDWTIHKALSRWPLSVPVYWSTRPCPNPVCGFRTIRVTPPGRPGADFGFICKACHWEPPVDDVEAWHAYFHGGITA